MFNKKYATQPKYKKTLFRGQKNIKHLFCGTPSSLCVNHLNNLLHTNPYYRPFHKTLPRSGAFVKKWFL